MDKKKNCENLKEYLKTVFILAGINSYTPENIKEIGQKRINNYIRNDKK